MKLNIRRTFSTQETKYEVAGKVGDPPLRKVAAVAVVENPYISGYVEDLREFIAASEGLGEMLARQALEAMGGMGVESYGKGGIVGISGEQEHANALLTTTFANPIRDAIGGAEAWISSMTKVSAPGLPIDIPMNYKDEVYVRSHYDGMTLTLPETPLPDEIAVIICLANRGRINARVGGITVQQVKEKNGVTGC